MSGVMGESWSKCREDDGFDNLLSFFSLGFLWFICGKVDRTLEHNLEILEFSRDIKEISAYDAFPKRQ